jgi:hypothetical protein
MAVASSARLRVWHGDSPGEIVQAPCPAPGIARFGGQKVYWGPGILDLASGEFRVIEDAKPEIWPGGGERPFVYAWSPAGDRLLASFSTANANHPSRTALFNGETGTLIATLPNGTGLPPQAAWLGRHAAVVGFNHPRVFDLAGRQIAVIAVEAGNVSNIAAPENESRLILLDLNRNICVVDTASWAILDTWRGPWMYAAVSPDGKVVAALEAWEKIHFARLQDDRVHPSSVVPIDPSAVAIALADDQIAAVGGGELRWARFHHRDS